MKKTICNKCGKEFDEFDKQEGISVSRIVGYGSVFDGDRLDLDLCAECVDNIIRNCKISPITEIGYHKQTG